MGRYRLLSLMVLCSYLSILLLGAFCIAMGDVMPMRNHSVSTIECVFDCPVMAQGQALTWFTINHFTLLPFLFIFFVAWSIAVFHTNYAIQKIEPKSYHPPPDTKLFSFLILLYARGIIQPKLCASRA